MRTLPTKIEIARMIELLIQGSKSRKEISNWALSYWLDDDVYVDDKSVWDTLAHLTAADLISTDRPYLYEEADFRAWLEELTEKDKP